MISKLGVYWSVMHRRPQDYDYFKQLQPSVFKIMDGGPPDYQFARDNLPSALVIARDWALSEQHSDMLKDPIGTGQRHAQEWDGHQRRLGFDRAKTLILGINEPHIWEAGVPEALRQYTIAMCDKATELGLRVGAMQLSVGWPNNDGPDTPPNWSQWRGVDNAIRRNNGALVGHEYWADNGPSENWGWWAGRILKCPWQVPIVVGETGVDIFVKDGSVPHQSRGWRGRMEPQRYARELADYVGRMSADSRFVGCAVFASDFANGEWASFDIEPAYQAILATPIPAAPPPPITTPAPADGPVRTVAFVKALAGANVRVGPGEHRDKVETLPYGAQVSVLYRERFDFGGSQEWAMLDDKRWIAAWLLGADKPPVVQPTPSEPSGHPVTPAPGGDADKWSRAWPIVLKIEGGLSLDPNDTGNYYQGRLIGTKYGISAAVWGGQYDIPNLTKETALGIYKRAYWDAANCDAQPWPMCLIHFDTSVNHGVGVAQKLLNYKPTREEIYLGLRLLRYVEDPKWRNFGVAWGNRVEHLDDIVDGEVSA